MLVESVGNSRNETGKKKDAIAKQPEAQDRMEVITKIENGPHFT